MPFQKGNQINKGRHTSVSGNGAKPKWFREKLRQLASHERVYQYFNRVLSGEQIEPHLTRSGKIIKTEPTIQDYMTVWREAAHYGYGKPVQQVQLADEDGNFPSFVISLGLRQDIPKKEIPNGKANLSLDAPSRPSN